jgi:hypothetical protein
MLSVVLYMAICICRQRQQFIVFNNARQYDYFRHKYKRLNKVECFINVLELAISGEFYIYRNIGILGALFCVPFCY